MSRWTDIAQVPFPWVFMDYDEVKVHKHKKNEKDFAL